MGLDSLSSPVALVFVYALLTALMTGLGALPYAFMKTVSPRSVAHANALATGLMLGASFGLVAEGMSYGGVQTFVGVVAGLVFVALASRFLEGHDFQLGAARGASARRMLLMVAVMTAHSFSEGVAVGAAFGGGMSLAGVVAIAIAVHNVPEGIAISAVLRPRGVSVGGCAGWSIVSSLPQPLMAVPAFLLVDTLAVALPYSIGFAAGAMILMVFLELLPEAYEHCTGERIGAVVAVTAVAMFLFQHML